MVLTKSLWVLKFITIVFGMIGVSFLFALVLWCTYVTSVKDKHSKEHEVDIKTGVTRVILPTLTKNWITDVSSETYCTITECKIITCNFITSSSSSSTSSSSSSDSGHEASIFLDTVFKAQCPTKTTVSELIFSNANFPDNKLRENWLTSVVHIDSLKFEACEFNFIEAKSFSSSIFIKTKSLSIINSKINILNTYIFTELNNLRNLVIQNNLLMKVDYKLLNNLSETLETIAIDKSIEDIKVLFNITTGSQLPKVQLLSLQENNIPNLSNEILHAFPNLISLYLVSSRVQSIDPNAFKSTPKIKQIFLNDNELKMIYADIFDANVLQKPTFKIAINGNPWNCQCELKWLQDMIIIFPEMITKVPQCKTPESNAGKTFLSAQFCEHLNDDSQTSTPGTPPPDAISNFTFGSCLNASVQLQTLSRTLFAMPNYQLHSKTSSFVLYQLKNGSIVVNLDNNSSANKDEQFLESGKLSRLLFSMLDKELSSKTSGFVLHQLNNGSIVININKNNSRNEGGQSLELEKLCRRLFSMLDKELSSKTSGFVLHQLKNGSIVINLNKNNPRNEDGQSLELGKLSRKLLSMPKNELPPKASGFDLYQLKNGSVIINLDKNNAGSLILWFSADEHNQDINEVYCIRNVIAPVHLDHLKNDTLYIVCLIRKIDIHQILPFDCRALKTFTTQNKRVWLYTSDKTLILSVYTVIAFLFSLLGSGSCFLILKRHPSLLKGSKRVIMVQHGKINALVLPKGVNSDSVDKSERDGKLAEDNFEMKIVADYLTPIEEKKNIFSNNYESIRKKSVNISNLDALTRENMREGDDNNYDNPPPLPPHPFRGVIPTVSLMMDSEEKKNEYN